MRRHRGRVSRVDRRKERRAAGQPAAAPFPLVAAPQSDRPSCCRHPFPSRATHRTSCHLIHHSHRTAIATTQTPLQPHPSAGPLRPSPSASIAGAARRSDPPISAHVLTSGESLYFTHCCRDQRRRATCDRSEAETQLSEPDAAVDARRSLIALLRSSPVTVAVIFVVCATRLSSLSRRHDESS